MGRTKIKYSQSWKESAPLPTTLAGRVRSFFRAIALTGAAMAYKRSDALFVRCLYSHTVFEDQSHDFDRIIENLKNEGDFISTDNCLELLSGQTPLDGRYFHLSFDDGFRHCATVAAPVLTKHKVPALFFIPTALIGANDEDTAAYCLSTTKYRAVIEMLQWSDVQSLASEGFEIGSHTRTHVRLAAISDNAEMLFDEVVRSKQDIERRIHSPCHYISWPYGTRDDIDDRALSAIRDAGYRACFGAFRGSIVPKGTDSFLIPRHDFKVEWPLSHIKYFARGNMERAA